MRLVVPAYKRLTESWESQKRGNRYHPASVVKGAKRADHILSVGSYDTWQVFRIQGDKSGLWFVPFFSRLFGYTGIEAFYPDDEYASDDRSFFLQGEENCRTVLGDNWSEIADRTIFRRLIQWYLEVTS